MIYDFHTHTFLSDGVHSPIELIRFASVSGYGYIGITDHASCSNLDFIITRLRKDCELAGKYWNIKAIPGVELTNVPAKSINGMAREAKEMGAEIVVVHGETIAEDVEPGTNLEVVKSEYTDILAHPGFLKLEEAKLAAKNGVFIEITYRAGHSLTNGVVADVGREAGVKFVIDSDAHSLNDLFRPGVQEKVGLGSGLNKDEVKEILDKNNRELLRRIDNR
ncbi:MAG: histidinol phosphate phosphatase domain-containing protein [Actinomycetota bacterium]|nr:histidinol phosphate phosphatase domain-containing protein [Actinomycetota bacterium]